MVEQGRTSCFRHVARLGPCKGCCRDIKGSAAISDSDQRVNSYSLSRNFIQPVSPRGPRSLAPRNAALVQVFSGVEPVSPRKVTAGIGKPAIKSEKFQ